MQISEVAAPETLADALSFYKRFPKVVPSMGCTSLILSSNREPASILSLQNIAELKIINKTDRFIELGAGVPLMKISGLPRVPQLEPLRAAIESIGTFTVRNIASFGGNLFSNGSGTLFPVLTLLDANCELRSTNAVKNIRLHNMIGEDGVPVLPPESIITKIRIPLDFTWPVHFIARNAPNCFPGKHNYLVALFADFSGPNCTNMRIMFHDGRCMRVRPLELYLIGKTMPLPKDDIRDAYAILSDFFAEHTIDKPGCDFFMEELINLLHIGIEEYL